MKIYLDETFFFDLFGGTIPEIRNPRRGRSVLELKEDAEELAQIIKAGSVNAITSLISFHGFETEIFSCEFVKRIESRKARVLLSRSIREWLRHYCSDKRIDIINLRKKVLEEIVKPPYINLTLNDSIHLYTAQSEGCKILVSGDEDLQNFDVKDGSKELETYRNHFGMCVLDTDRAIERIKSK